MVWTVLLHPDADVEPSKIPAREQAAIDAALDKLGPTERCWVSAQQCGSGRRRWVAELRPRQGRSPWRAFYRQIRPALVVGSIDPEAGVDPKELTRAVRAVERRLDEVEEDE